MAYMLTPLQREIRRRSYYTWERPRAAKSERHLQRPDVDFGSVIATGNKELGGGVFRRAAVRCKKLTGLVAIAQAKVCMMSRSKSGNDTNIALSYRLSLCCAFSCPGECFPFLDLCMGATNSLMAGHVKLGSTGQTCIKGR